MSDYLITQNFLKAVTARAFRCSGCLLGLVLFAQVIYADDATTNSQQGSAQKRTTLIKQLSQKTLSTLKSEGISRQSLAAQEELMNSLEQLIKLSSGTNTSQPSTDQSSQTPKETETQPGPGNGTKSSNQSGTAGAAPSENGKQPTMVQNLKTRSNLADSVWGHLPEQERNDLLRTYSESYLPGYELQVRRYFEQLAKMRRREQKKDSRIPVN